MAEFTDAVAAGRDYSAIPNLWVKKRGPGGGLPGSREITRNFVRPLIKDLDALPFADRDLYMGYKYFHNKPFEGFLAGRGCPYDCTFCFNHQFRELYGGARDRRRTARNVVDEIKAVHGSKPIRIVWFMDSTFNLNREWFLSFCDLFARESDLGMTCNVRLHLLDDDMARAMAKARCRSARFAIESGNEGLRNRVLKKVLKDEDILAGVELFRKHGVPFATANMMGMPDETLAMAWETILINRRIQPMFVDMGLFTPYPNLEITEYAKRQGCLTDAGIEEMAHGRKKMLSSVLKQPEIKEVCNLHKFFYLLVRHPWLDPIARKLVRLPENRFFDMIFGASYIVENCRRTDVPYSYGRMLLNAMKNFAQIS